MLQFCSMLVGGGSNISSFLVFAVLFACAWSGIQVMSLNFSYFLEQFYTWKLEDQPKLSYVKIWVPFSNCPLFGGLSHSLRVPGPSFLM